MARPGLFTTLEDEIRWAQESHVKALRKLAELDREGRNYYGEDRTLYPSHFAYHLLKANEAVKKAKRKLTTLMNKDKRTKQKRNPLGSKHKVIAKKRRSAAQIRATKKMIAAARARRTKKKVPRRKRNPVGNTIRGTYQTARADPRQVRKRTPVRTGRRMNPMNHYGIKSGGRWFNGRGWTTTKNNAAMWKTLATARDVAQTLSDHTNKPVTIHSM
jgi:hypothetical protein